LVRPIVKLKPLAVMIGNWKNTKKTEAKKSAIGVFYVLFNINYLHDSHFSGSMRLYNRSFNTLL
jgi:hypothetical protein